MPAKSSGMNSGSASGLGRAGSSTISVRIPSSMDEVQPKKNVSRQRPATTRSIGSSQTRIALPMIATVSSDSSSRWPAPQVAPRYARPAVPIASVSTQPVRTVDMRKRRSAGSASGIEPPTLIGGLSARIARR